MLFIQQVSRSTQRFQLLVRRLTLSNTGIPFSRRLEPQSGIIRTSLSYADTATSTDTRYPWRDFLRIPRPMPSSYQNALILSLLPSRKRPIAGSQLMYLAIRAAMIEVSPLRFSTVPLKPRIQACGVAFFGSFDLVVFGRHELDALWLAMPHLPSTCNNWRRRVDVQNSASSCSQRKGETPVRRWVRSGRLIVWPTSTAAIFTRKRSSARRSTLELDQQLLPWRSISS